MTPNGHNECRSRRIYAPSLFAGLVGGILALLMAASGNRLFAQELPPVPYRLLSSALAEPPIITLQPQSQTVLPGTNVTLRVEATGTPPLTYQWRLNGVIIPGATNPVVTFTNIEATAGGSYQAIVANEFGVATSQIAAINVISRPLTLSDNLADRMTLGAPSWVGAGSNVGATVEPGETNHVGAPSGRSVWLAWVAPSNGVTTVSTRGSTFDTLLAVYTGPDMTRLTNVVSDEDSGGFYTSTVRFNAVLGTEYLFAIDGYGGTDGNVLLTLSMLPDATIPHIIVHPVSRTVPAGSSVSFTVTATNSPPETVLSYRWQFNGADILGATNDILAITNVQPESVGHYRVLVGNSSGLEAISQEAVLEIGPDGQVLSQDKLAEQAAPLVAATRGKATIKPAAFTPGFFSVSIGTIGAQLFDNLGSGKHPGEPDHCGVLGGASKFLDFTATDAGVAVLDTSGSKIDTVLAVYNRVTLSQLSANLVICDNNSASDGSRSRVRFPCEAGRAYRAFVDGVGGAQGLMTLNWKLGRPPAFASPGARHVTVQASGTLRLEPEFTGAFAPAEFQWLHNGTAIPSGTNAFLVLPSVSDVHAGKYTLIAQNEFGAITGDVAEVEVQAAWIPQLVIRAPVNGVFRIELQDAAGRSWLLFGSTDLVNWLPVHTNLNATSAAFFEVTTSNGMQQFFRAQPLP